MPNLVNEAIQREYEKILGEDLDVLFVQPVGLSVAAANAFRGRLAGSHLRMQLLKGSLARRTLEARGLAVGAFFEGPAAVILADGAGEGVAIAASRVVAAWRKESKQELPTIKGGVLDGQCLAAHVAESLAKLPTAAELHARVCGQILAPGRRLSSQLRAPGARLASQLKARLEKTDLPAPAAS